MQDLEITDYHSSLQKLECNGDEMVLTFKNGTDYAVPMSSIVTFMASQWNADQLNALIGMYEPRPDITLTSLEEGKVINASGVKVAKSGWAIAEFTAQLGNVYLFNPGATASDVCVFAEKIDKVETRGVDYAYTYDAKGNPLTAKATYNGATHSYTYTNTYTTQDGHESLSVVITDDQTGKTVEYLPQTYQTTVGAYQPMVRLNENAELPKDGYCRFVSNFQTSDSIRIAVSYKVDSADLVMKVVRSGMVASMCTQLSKINQKVDEAKAAIEVLNKEVDRMSNGLGMVGFCRVNGDVSCDPASDQVYGTKAMIHEIGKHFRLGLAKTNGNVCDIKRMAPGRLTLGADGQKHAIDGTEGDVMLVFDDDVYLQKCTQMVNGVELNCMGVSMNAHAWHGHAAKHFAPFAISPHYTVNAKLEGDERSQAHVVWNREAKGTMNEVDPILKATYKQAGGAHTQYVSNVSAIQLAQAKNTDPLTNRPWMCQYYEFYEIWAALLQIECGTLAHTRLNLFGTGDTPLDAVNANTWHDAQMSGNSGYKVVKADGSLSWCNIHAYHKFLVSGSDNEYSLLSAICGGNIYNPVDMLEGQRFLDGMAEAGLLDYLGDTSALFTLTDDGVVTKVDGVNVDTGEGMETCKHYYQARNVPGCEGMADGVMTAVVNSYTKLEFADGVTDLNGNTVVTAYLKRSMPIYRGKSLPYQGCFEQTFGAHYTIIVGETTSDITTEFRCASDVNNIPPLKTFGAEVYKGASDTTVAMERGLDNIVNRDNLMQNEAWMTKCDYSLSLFAFSAYGGSSRSRENSYLWLYKGNNAGVGKRQVHGSSVGCFASTWNASASVRTAFWNGAAGDGSLIYAGALASYPVQIIN